ncbi:MAG TPA: hypothetical protein VGM02_09635 [Acidobacteriaceae bacterium]|jgi:hypothetical protein
MKFVCVSLVFALGATGLWAQPQPDPSTLPAKPGIYAIDSSIQPPTQIRLRASEVRFNRHTGNNIARNSFYMNSKTTLDIAGKSAEVSMAPGKASFLVPSDPESPALALSRLTLVRLQTDADRRILAALKTNAFGGSPGRKIDAITVAKETLPGGDWVRITPTVELTPGEYAIAYFPEDPRMFPDSIFDFRIDAAK